VAGVSCNAPGVCCGQRLPKLRGDVRRSERAADIDGRAPELRGRGRDLCQTYTGSRTRRAARIRQLRDDRSGGFNPGSLARHHRHSDRR
jgi:hypothetical protein